MLEEDESEASRRECFLALSLFCRCFFLSFACAWFTFVLVFGTGRMFTWIKTLDAAVTTK